MLLALALSCAAAFGAVARYATSVWMQQYQSDSLGGTLVANVLGSLGAGLVAGAALSGALPSSWHLVLSTGFLGAYTTFSTWMVESATLLREGRWRLLLGYTLGSTLLGTAAAALGLALML
ncbi:MAG: CrcB family protein [Longimonas sp.]|uniref:FluC/FEX family fluoride channel n=1 Tax=Longimonas sp. TaxID=2039626 RepID=UPI003975A827